MTNPWSSSPSPSLDASSLESSSSSSFSAGRHLVMTLPTRLWDVYVAYLWYYQPNSWVGRVASTFRILALALVLPVVLLTLLDVTSYVIVRTLGVVDDVKASTSDAEPAADERRAGTAVAVPVSACVPATFSSEGSVRGSEGLVPEDSTDGQTGGDELGRASDGAAVHARSATAQDLGQERRTQTQTHACYFVGEHLRLAGEGVFSPAVSVPPSPLTPRMPLHTFAESDGRESGQASEEEGVVLRRRVQGACGDELDRA